MPADAGFVICVDPAKHDDLQSRRVYRRIPDPSAARSSFVRVIDDSGEDYLYPESCFMALPLPRAVRLALANLLTLAQGERDVRAGRTVSDRTADRRFTKRLRTLGSR